MNYLYPFAIDYSRIHFEDCRFDGSRRWQFSHANINRIRTFGIQYDQLLILCRFVLFLHKKPQR